MWQLTVSNGSPNLTLVSSNQWFGGRLLKSEDQLQSVGKYFPFGEDRYSPNPANPAGDTEKFATYTQDSATGLSYAMNRYYASGLGRFVTTDPDPSSGEAKSPQGWNRYAYVENDPVNKLDPSGRLWCWADYDYAEGYWGSVGCDGFAVEDRLYLFLPFIGGGGNTSGLKNVESAIQRAVRTQNVFTASELECIIGIETGLTWNPDIVAANGRIGLFQFNQASWQYSGTKIFVERRHTGEGYIHVFFGRVGPAVQGSWLLWRSESNSSGNSRCNRQIWRRRWEVWRGRNELREGYGRRKYFTGRTDSSNLHELESRQIESC